MPPTKRSRQMGRLIKQHRQAKGLSLRQAAELTEYHHSYFARLEAGDYQSPAPKQLKVLSRVLEIPIEDLYALADYDLPDRLPDFAPYLRAKFDMPEEAVERLEEYFRMLQEKHQADSYEGKARSGAPAPSIRPKRRRKEQA